MILRRFFRTGFGIALLLIPLATSLVAQEVLPRERKSSFILGGGIAVPGDNVNQYMSRSGLVRVGYGYRFSRYFQMDVSLDAIPHAAGVSITQQTPVGEVHIQDNEYLVPFGGRAVLPLSGRVELFGGGGVLYMRYQEEASLPSGIHIGSLGGGYWVDVDCPSCKSRSGWGFYGSAGGNVALDRRQRVWLGLEIRSIRGKTSGKPLGSGAGSESKDAWLNTIVNFAYRF